MLKLHLVTLDCSACVAR